MSSGVQDTNTYESKRFENSLLRGGIYLLLAGLVVLTVPEMLIALVAGGLILTGAGFLLLSWQLKKSAHHRQYVRIYIS